jgi:hypothetical protein
MNGEFGAVEAEPSADAGARGAAQPQGDLVRTVDGDAVPGSEIGSETAGLLAALEAADELPLDERLQLLRKAESTIAGVLEGLDGL